MTKKKSSKERYAAFALKMHRHMHNSLTGDMGMIQAIVNKIHWSRSTTPRAKELASQLAKIRTELAEEIYTYRVEPDGTTVKPNHKTTVNDHLEWDDYHD